MVVASQFYCMILVGIWIELNSKIQENTFVFYNIDISWQYKEIISNKEFMTSVFHFELRDWNKEDHDKRPISTVTWKSVFFKFEFELSRELEFCQFLIVRMFSSWTLFLIVRINPLKSNFTRRKIRTIPAIVAHLSG